MSLFSQRHDAGAPYTADWCFEPEQLAVDHSVVRSVTPQQRALARVRNVWRTAAASVRVRLALVVLTVAAAYHYSLLTLFRALSLDTPLAYLGLVPIMALGIGIMRGRPAAHEPDIHDRQVDYIIGLPLITLALSIVLFMPDRLSTLFWIYRIDILSLPLFVAGVVAVVFGVRTMWRLKFPIGFLLLAWPVPYNMLIDRGLDQATLVTIGALKRALEVVPVGVPTPGSDGSLFMVGAGTPNQFVVSVASACAGVNSVVGFLLVGIAFTALIEGRRLPKLLWLLGGLSLIYAMNIGRLVMIFWFGQTWGEKAAIDGLHPYIGLVLFCVGICIMIATMGLFGLRVAGAGGPASKKKGRRGPQPPRPPAVVSAGQVRRSAPKWALSGPLKGAAVLVVATGMVLGVANSGLRQYELVASDLGTPRLAAFTTTPASVPSWSVAQINQYEWVKRFFGDKSSWLRYQYVAQYGAYGAGSSPVPIIADVVSTKKLGTFSTYGIEACYKFHGYEISSERSDDLGGGVTGKSITYTDPKKNRSWNGLYWIWPVQAADGVRYERVVLLVPSTGDGRGYYGGATNPSSDLTRNVGLNGKSTGKADPTVVDKEIAVREAASREFLLTFGKQLVAAQSAAPPTTTTAAGPIR